MVQGKTTHTRTLRSVPAGGWKEHSGDVYRCRVHLMPGTQGGFVATVAGLPGVSGAGATEAEALVAVTDSLRAQGKRPSPESQIEEPPPGAVVRWVVVYPAPR
jgi:hypothetical protein